mgnify:CR=1
MAQALIQIVIPFAAMFAIMYFLLILPEKKRSKKYNILSNTNMFSSFILNFKFMDRTYIITRVNRGSNIT